MSLQLPTPSPAYEPENESQARQAMQQADLQNLKVGDVLTKLLFKDTVTGVTKTVTIASGAFVIT